MSGWRRWAGLWGPAAFGAASVAAAPRQAGYSHRRQPISALAACGTRSAAVMVPGFYALGVSQLALSSAVRAADPEHRTVPTLLRTAGLGVLGAALFRCSGPDCPLPGTPEAKPTDVGHGITSVTAFTSWVALPVVAAAGAVPALGARHRRFSRVLALPTVVAFAAAASTAQRRSDTSGTAQRTFLGLVGAWCAATSLALQA